MDKIQKKKKLSEYLRSRLFIMRASLLAVSLGLGCFLGNAAWNKLFAPEATVFEELPATHVDALRYEELCHFLEQGDWHKSHQSCLSIARNAADADFSAWASCYAWIICYLHDELKAELPTATQLVQEHMAQLATQSTQGLPCHGDLILLKDVMAYQGEGIPEFKALVHPLLQAMQLIYLSSLYGASGQSEQEEELLRQARHHLLLAANPFQKTDALLPPVEPADEPAVLDDDGSAQPSQDIAISDEPKEDHSPLPTVSYEEALKQWQKDCTELPFDQLLMKTQDFLKHQSMHDDLADKPKAVLEICRAALALLSFYERQDPIPIWAGQTQERSLSRAEDLSLNKNQSRFLELKCMSLLLQAKYDEVRSYSPSIDNSKPFAVLLQHWLKTLEKKEAPKSEDLEDVL